MDIDNRALRCIETLQRRGHQAYLVGGCVRDCLLGKQAADWDIATSATPNEVLSCFADTSFRVVATGLRHGTVTVLIDALPLEVTTFRQDGEYTDNRHPASVTFVPDLKEDLARRDFTINALAYDLEAGVLDYFGGQDDLKGRRIRAVGNPDARLTEDALRIMRALRFSSVLGFTIEPDLSRSLHAHKDLLSTISAERISAELSKLLLGENVLEVLMTYPDVLSVFIPEIMPTVGFDQQTPYHIYDVWTHIARSVAVAPPEIPVRLTMLFHDLGKPPMFTQDSEGRGHFYQHGKVSEETAQRRLKELRFSNDTVSLVTRLVKWHDVPIASENLARWLNKLDEKGLRTLLDVKRADALAQNEVYGLERIALINKLEQDLDVLLAHDQCFKLSDLAVSGHDILRLGVSEGKQVGSILDTLLQKVMDGELPNNKALLLQAAEELLLQARA